MVTLETYIAKDNTRFDLYISKLYEELFALHINGHLIFHYRTRQEADYVLSILIASHGGVSNPSSENSSSDKIEHFPIKVEETLLSNNREVETFLDIPIILILNFALYGMKEKFKKRIYLDHHTKELLEQRIQKLEDYFNTRTI